MLIARQWTKTKKTWKMGKKCKQSKNEKRKFEKVKTMKVRTERRVTREGRQRGYKLHGAKSCVKDTMMSPLL